jgi:hypothetical protein
MTKCGCKIVITDNELSGWEGDSDIEFCPLHAKAPEMLTLLKLIFEARNQAEGVLVLSGIKSLISQIEGTHEG